MDLSPTERTDAPPAAPRIPRVVDRDHPERRRARPSGDHRATPRLPHLILIAAATLVGACPIPGVSTLVHAQQDPAPDRIAEIDLVGLSRVAEAKVLARMQIRVGDRYDERALAQEYQRLSDSGDFLYIEDAVVEQRADGIHITIRFEEKQRIVDVRLSGMESLGRTTTKDALALRKGALYDRQSLIQDLAELERRYHEAGFPFVAIDTEIVPVEDGVVVIFKISEGNRIEIHQIEFAGAKSFRRGELLDAISLRERSWFLGIPHSGRLRRDVLFEAVEQLRSFYRRKGFFDANIAVDPIELSPERTEVSIRFVIVEGARYTVKAIDFVVPDDDGDRALSDAELLELIEIGPGDPWDGEVISEDRDKLQRAYSNISHVDAQIAIEPIYELSGNAVTLRFTITEGAKAFIEEIKIRGNVETRDKVIRRQLTFYPGEEIRRDKIEDSVSNLYRIGYFSNVTPAWEAGSRPGYKNIIIDVEETSTGRLIFGLGVTTGQGVSGSFSLQKSNFDITDLPESFSDLPDAFSGGGQTLVLQAQPGTQFSRYRAQFTEPFLLDTLNSLSVDTGRSAFIREDYTEQRTYAEVSLGRRFLFDRRLTAELGYRYEVVDADDLDDDAIPSVVAVEGKTHISSITTGLRYERRTFRPIVGPVDGWTARVGYEYAGGPLGAELDMSKANASLDFYATIFSDGDSNRHIIAFRNDVSWVEGHHDTTEIPIFERYYLGGSSTLRGFRFREVGPKEQGEPVGGTMRHFGSLEYTFPLYEDILRGIVFSDYGNLSPDIDSFHANEYRLAVGGGVLLSIPFLGQYLPISLTWADATLKEDGDRTQQFLFDIGFGF